MQKKRQQYPASFGKSLGFLVNRHQPIAVSRRVTILFHFPRSPHVTVELDKKRKNGLFNENFLTCFFCQVAAVEAEYFKVGEEVLSNTALWKRMQAKDGAGDKDACPKPLEFVNNAAKDAVEVCIDPIGSITPLFAIGPLSYCRMSLE